MNVIIGKIHDEQDDAHEKDGRALHQRAGKGDFFGGALFPRKDQEGIEIFRHSHSLIGSRTEVFGRKNFPQNNIIFPKVKQRFSGQNCLDFAAAVTVSTSGT
jgi:hypothetical protein